MIQHKVDTYIWMDYGIGHVPGVTVDVVKDFLAQVRTDDFAIPGCWPKEGLMISDFWPCWRFCGGLIVIPRQKVYRLYRAIKDTVTYQLSKTRNLAWEVNTLATMEKNTSMPIRWYYADHNETMFTNYTKGLPHASSDPAPVTLPASDVGGPPSR